MAQNETVHDIIIYINLTELELDSYIFLQSKAYIGSQIEKRQDKFIPSILLINQYILEAWTSDFVLSAAITDTFVESAPGYVEHSFSEVLTIRMSTQHPYLELVYSRKDICLYLIFEEDPIISDAI